jgi:predicted aspartyl protease
MLNRVLIAIIITTLMLGFTKSVLATNPETTSIDLLLQQSGYSVQPISIKNDFLYISGFVDKHPVVAILDTGSAGIGVTQGTAKKLQLMAFNAPTKNIDMKGRASSLQIVMLPKVSFSTIYLNKIQANIFQHVAESGNIPTLVIGRDFLKRYHAVIDIYHRKLYLSERKLSAQTQARLEELLSEQKFQAIPLMTMASGDMVIPLQINEAKPANFLFDTGTGVTLLSQEYAKALNLKQINKTQVSVNHMLMNPLNVSFQPEIVLNNFSVQPTDFTVMRKYLYVQGILGLSEMIKVRAIILLEKGVMYCLST